jgi:tetratricopeptide (TPR) repeat protein
MTRYLLLLSLSLLTLSPARHAMAQDAPPPISATAKAAFAKAVKHLEAKQYAEALVSLKEVLKEVPEDPSALWNAGMAAFFTRDFVAAKSYYTTLKKQEPTDGFLRTKLIQIYQAQGDRVGRDRERAELLALHYGGKDTSRLAKEKSFCRDQFVTDKGQRVLLYEMFTLEPRTPDSGRFAVRYNILVADREGSVDQRIEVGWNFVEKNSKGEWVGAGELAAFYFDAYPKTGPYARITYGLFGQELSYEEVRSLIVRILDGKIKPVGSSARKTVP